MTYSAYGYGINSQVGNCVAAFGLGLDPLGPITAAAIAFNIDVDDFYDPAVIKDANVVFDINLFKEILEQLQANTTTTFSINLTEEQQTQLDFNPTIEFEVQTLYDFVGNLILNDDISLDFIAGLDFQTFLAQFVLTPGDVLLVEEEIRLMSIFKEVREFIIGLQNRTVGIKYENRTEVIPKKDNKEDIGD